MMGWAAIRADKFNNRGGFVEEMIITIHSKPDQEAVSIYIEKASGTGNTTRLAVSKRSLLDAIEQEVV
jgi:hypothetical protein